MVWVFRPAGLPAFSCRDFLPTFSPDLPHRMKGMKMPGKIQAFRELPGDIQKLTMLASFAIALSMLAIMIAMGARHAN